MKSVAVATSASQTRSSGRSKSIGILGHDVLCLIFSTLDLFDLVRCTAVCKSWNAVISKFKLLEVLYCKYRSTDSSGVSKELAKMYLEDLAVEQHRKALQEGHIYIDQWKGHSVGVEQCRMKKEFILTGVGDKVLRLWSSKSNKCLEEYPLPGSAPLVDFDFDESKIVGLVGTHIGIWRRGGKMNIFPSHESIFTKALCMRYIDPEAVVGCEDGTARVFDMYSRKCSRIIRTSFGPITCLHLTDDQLILSGSSIGIVVSSLSCGHHLSTLSSFYCPRGMRTLCFNPCSQLVFAGSAAGFVFCWDLRTMRRLWEGRVSSNVIYSIQHLQNDTSVLAVGGIDGVLRFLNQDTGEVVSQCVMHSSSRILSSCETTQGLLVQRTEGRRLPENTTICGLDTRNRPPITSLAVGMKKVVTTHGGKYVRTWTFDTVV